MAAQHYQKKKKTTFPGTQNWCMGGAMPWAQVFLTPDAEIVELVPSWWNEGTSLPWFLVFQQSDLKSCQGSASGYIMGPWLACNRHFPSLTWDTKCKKRSVLTMFIWLVLGTSSHSSRLLPVLSNSYLVSHPPVPTKGIHRLNHGASLCVASLLQSS